MSIQIFEIANVCYVSHNESGIRRRVRVDLQYQTVRVARQAIEAFNRFVYRSLRARLDGKTENARPAFRLHLK